MNSEAEEYKVRGNKFFSKKDYLKSLEEYNKAIEIDPKNGNYYSNRSLVFIRLEQFGEAIRDANMGIELDFKKSFYRRACSYLALGNFEKALKDFKILKSIYPKNEDILKKYKFCITEIRKEILAKAIENVNTIPISERIDINSIIIDPEYDGLKLEFPLTLDQVKEVMEEFKNQKLIHKKYVMQVILEALKIFKNEKTLIKTNIPDGCAFSICGDIHGQYYDLLNIFNINGLPSDTNYYLFNGDFVDRGPFSFECITLLFCFKILFPNSFYLNRGNHESQSMNKVYGFRNEVIDKYDEQTYEVFAEVFQWLPLAHMLDSKVLIVHGGLFSEDDVSLSDIEKIERVREPPENGLMCELLWSDPCDENGRQLSKRGVGINFGPDVLTSFLKYNSLEILIRSHEVKDNGAEVKHDRKLITVFSAPKYCDTMNNLGAIVKFDDTGNYEIIKFAGSEHPEIASMKYCMNFA